MTYPCWQPLDCSIDTLQPKTEGDIPIWYWVPGWSFDAEVFTTIAKRIPGRHWGLCYSTLLELTTDKTLAGAARALAQHSHSGAHWVGWSLGGALATLASAQRQPEKLCILATGQRFISTPSASDVEQPSGLPSTTLDAFEKGLHTQPEKTLKRFLSLCSAGCSGGRSEMRQLTQQLGASQLNNTTTLMQTLTWLRQIELTPDVQSGLAFYGKNDALNPGGLMPSIELPGSHAFWLETQNQQVLLNSLTSASSLTGVQRLL